MGGVGHPKNTYLNAGYTTANIFGCKYPEILPLVQYQQHVGYNLFGGATTGRPFIEGFLEAPPQT